jgi:hypothetical protein
MTPISLSSFALISIWSAWIQHCSDRHPASMVGRSRMSGPCLAGKIGAKLASSHQGAPDRAPVATVAVCGRKGRKRPAPDLVLGMEAVRVWPLWPLGGGWRCCPATYGHTGGHGVRGGDSRACFRGSAMHRRREASWCEVDWKRTALYRHQSPREESLWLPRPEAFASRDKGTSGGLGILSPL